MNKLMIKLIAAALAFSFPLMGVADHNTEEALHNRTAPVGTLNVSTDGTQPSAAAEPRDMVSQFTTPPVWHVMELERRAHPW